MDDTALRRMLRAGGRPSRDNEKEGVALSMPFWETAATACRPPLKKIGLFIRILECRAPAPGWI